MQPTGEGQRAVLYIEGEVVDVQAAGGHYLDRLEIPHFPIIEDVDVGDFGGFAHIHTAGNGRGEIGTQEKATPMV